MKITDTIKYVGVNDHRIDLFEGQYKVPGGMSYNSYVILDEKIAVMDTVDADFTHQWLDNIQQVLDGRKPDYLIVQHMEPDHAANVANFLKVYPDTTVVATGKAFGMIRNFFELDLEGKKIEAENGSTLSLGYHQLTFVFAPMVHWPEVMVDSTGKVLFPQMALRSSERWMWKNHGMTRQEDILSVSWENTVHRYRNFSSGHSRYSENLSASTCSYRRSPDIISGFYDTWSSYTKQEDDGIVIAYTSVYGNPTPEWQFLLLKIKSKGCPRVLVYDLARDDMSHKIE